MSDSELLTYQDRIIAFVDVLGFSKLTLASAHDEASLKTLSDLVATNRVFEDFYKKIMEFGTATFFSDTFVVSMEPDQAWYLFRHTGQLCRYLLLRGLPCRGAITVGPLHHVANVIAGPALVEAYELERKIAVTPRVVLDEGAVALWKNEFHEGCAYPELEALIKEGGNRYFLDIFHPRWADAFQSWPDDAPTDHADFVKAAMSVVERSREANAANDGVRQKYDWLAAECANHMSAKS